MLCMTMVAMLAIVSCAKEDAFLTVSVSQLEFPVGGGETTIAINANGSWVIYGWGLGLSVSPSSGSGSALVTVKADVNFMLGDRISDLLVSMGSVSRKVNVIQGGRMIEKLSIHVPQAGGLGNLLTNYMVEAIEELKLSGYLNASDFNQLKTMYMLSHLDISDCILDKNEIPGFLFYTAMDEMNSRLEEIKFPPTLKYIRNRAFYNCTKLKMPIFPIDLEVIEQFAFSGCTSLSGHLDLPRALTTIENAAFLLCGNISSATFPISLRIIGNEAFKMCTGLSGELKLPNMTSIGAAAFSSTNYSVCRISAVTPPAVGLGFLPRGTLVFVPTGARGAYLAAGYWAEYSVIDNENKVTVAVGADVSLEEALQDLGLDGSGISRLAISGSLSGADYHFIRTQMPVLMFLDLSATSITEIPASAFMSMSVLYEVLLPVGLTGIGASAFSDCKYLTNVSFPSGVQSIGEAAFYNCSSLAGPLVLPSALSSLGAQAFMNCSNLSGGLSFPAGLTNLPEAAFRGCSSLQNLTISATLTHIASYAFLGCSNLTAIYCNSAMPSVLGRDVFYGVIKSQCFLYVPMGASAVYIADDGWSTFTRVLER